MWFWIKRKLFTIQVVLVFIWRFIVDAIKGRR